MRTMHAVGVRARSGSKTPRCKTLRALLVATTLIAADLPASAAEEVFVTIGGGDHTGVYFPAGQAIAALLTGGRDTHGMRATVEATSGSTFNLDAITAGYMSFGLAQADRQYEAANGLADWAGREPRERLRSVFSLHVEAVTLVAALDAGVRSVRDLEGKRVSAGNPGRSGHRTVMAVLRAAGLDAGKDLDLQVVTASEAPDMLEDGRIDAYFFTVGHPNDTVREALTLTRPTAIVPLSSPGTERVAEGGVPYVDTTIAVSAHYPEAGRQADVETFGVTATLSTSESVPSDVVYTLTREVFENLETIRDAHPALSGLTEEGMLEGLDAPLHEGARRYYREAGLLR